LGYQAGPTAGDGGQWAVTFDEAGRVVAVAGDALDFLATCDE